MIFLEGFIMKKEVVIAVAIAGLLSSLSAGETNVDIKKVEIKPDGKLEAPKPLQGQIDAKKDLKIENKDAYNAIGCSNKKCGGDNKVKIIDKNKLKAPTKP